MVIPHFPRIGSLESNMVSCMLNLKLDYSKATDNDYLMKLGCDCGELFIPQAIVEGVKKRGGLKKESRLNH